MAKAGRPKLSAKRRKKSIISMRVQPHERKALERAAAASGQKLSAWIRKIVLDALKTDE